MNIQSHLRSISHISHHCYKDDYSWLPPHQACYKSWVSQNSITKTQHHGPEITQEESLDWTLSTKAWQRATMPPIGPSQILQLREGKLLPCLQLKHSQQGQMFLVPLWHRITPLKKNMGNIWHPTSCYYPRSHYCQLPCQAWMAPSPRS